MPKRSFPAREPGVAGAPGSDRAADAPAPPAPAPPGPYTPAAAAPGGLAIGNDPVAIGERIGAGQQPIVGGADGCEVGDVHGSSEMILPLPRGGGA